MRQLLLQTVHELDSHSHLTTRILRLYSSPESETRDNRAGMGGSTVGQGGTCPPPQIFGG